VQASCNLAPLVLGRVIQYLSSSGLRMRSSMAKSFMFQVARPRPIACARLGIRSASANALGRVCQSASAPAGSVAACRTPRAALHPTHSCGWLGSQLARALTFCHQLNVVHRDIKPENVLINTQTGIVKLADFGSAKQIFPGDKSITYITSRHTPPHPHTHTHPDTHPPLSLRNMARHTHRKRPCAILNREGTIVHPSLCTEEYPVSTLEYPSSSW
jgi:serine/threonine protein kinase